jgi:hypothetical protein
VVEVKAAALAAAAALAGCHHTGAGEELCAMFEADQRDRQGTADWRSLRARDDERRRRALAILETGGARTAENYYCAAMLFQHGPELADVHRARGLALLAVELKPDYLAARWLAAAALDRELLRSGKPQKYGTQYRKVQGRLELEPVDPATTDAERARWGVVPLAEAQRATGSEDR